MRQLVIKYVPFNKGNTQPQNLGSKQNTKQRHVSITKAHDDKGPTVNIIEVSNESEEDISYLLWHFNIHMKEIKMYRRKIKVCKNIERA